jgi:hypothetical protein
MRQDQALSEILEEVRVLAHRLPLTRWYGFGSYFETEAPFGDIDVLAVCPTTDDAVVVRTATQHICARWPLHLVIMTEDEEKETNFVVSEQCVAMPDIGIASTSG